MKPSALPPPPPGPPNLGFPLSFTAERELLTLHLQVLLRLEVFDGGMVHDANHGHAVVVPADGERQPAGDRVHLVVGQLHPGLPCGEEARRGDVKANRRQHGRRSKGQIGRFCEHNEAPEMQQNAKAVCLFAH